MFQSVIHIQALPNLAEDFTNDIPYLVSQCAGVEPDRLLLLAAEANRSVEIFRYLISLGADVNVKDNCRLTLLHNAAQWNSIEVLEYLISQGIDINAKDGFRRTVLYYTCTFNTPEVLQYLISQGADVNAGYGDDGNLLNTCLNYNGFGAGEVVGVKDEKKRILREAMAGQCEHYQKIAAADAKDRTGAGDRLLAYLAGDALNNYLHDMRIVQEYADLNRRAIVKELEKRVKFKIIEQFSMVHNYIDFDGMILRKGAISAQKDEKMLVPMNMRDGSLLCVGKNKRRSFGSGN